MNFYMIYSSKKYSDRKTDKFYIVSDVNKIDNIKLFQQQQQKRIYIYINRIIRSKVIV